MIFQTLKILATHLNVYLNKLDKPGGLAAVPSTILQNISRIDEQDLKKANNVMLTLVNLSEETAMKNDPGTYIHNSSVAHYANPPVNLNLYLLVTVCMANYEHALIYLSHTIGFFQGKYSFTSKDNIVPIDNLPDDFQIILDMQSLSFEQANYLWSTLGGKQQPFVCYKIRLVRIQRAAVKETRGVIREIRIDDPGKR